VESHPTQEAHVGPLNIIITLVALAVTCVLIAVTVSTLNAIDVAEIKTEAQQYNLTPGSAVKPGGSEPGYGVGRIAVPPGMKAFPAELVPVD
jgi:hypothetical protein